jgi:hypothetical protein
LGKKFFIESEQNVRYDTRYFREILPLSDLQERLCQLLAIFRSFSDAFFLDFGTLLGAYRNARMIPWDDDIDLGMFTEDLLALPPRHQVTPDTFFEVNPNTNQRQFDENNRVNARLICTRTGAYIDIFAYWLTEEDHFTSGERIYCKMESIPREILLPYGKIQFAGEVYGAPKDPRSYLVLTYGNDLTPDHRRIVEPDGHIRYERIR